MNTLQVLKGTFLYEGKIKNYTIEYVKENAYNLIIEGVDENEIPFEREFHIDKEGIDKFLEKMVI